MAVENIYKFAAENKLRFPFKGLISVEDLFDLKLEDLDSIYKTLAKQVKANDEESLLTEKTAEDAKLSVQIEIVKDVFAQKQDEIQARKNAAEKKKRNQQIAAIIANKENEELQNKSIDELKAMLEE